MRTVIVYATQHGTTEKVANMISELASDSTVLINLRKSHDVNPVDYDRIIIGGSIHAGKIQKIVRKFCERHMQQLTTKPLGLYLSCLEENEKAITQFETAYAENHRNHALSCKLTGGEVMIDGMNFIEKFMMKKIGGISESVSKIKEDKIKELVSEMGLC